jgi:hypothetical protein
MLGDLLMTETKTEYWNFKIEYPPIIMGFLFLRGKGWASGDYNSSIVAEYIKRILRLKYLGQYVETTDLCCYKMGILPAEIHYRDSVVFHCMPLVGHKKNSLSHPDPLGFLK